MWVDAWLRRGLGLSLMVQVTSASAAEVDWQAPAECPDVEELRFRVERTIGMPLSHAARLRFVARAAPSSGGYRAHVVIEGASGEARRRELTAPDCSALADLVTVTLALALGVADDEPLDAAAPAPAPPDTPLTAPRPSVEAALLGRDRAALAPASEAPDDARAWRPGLSLWVLGDSGSLPRPGAGVALGVQLESSQLELRALGTWVFEQRDTLGGPGDETPGAELGLATGALLACASPFAASSAGLGAQGCAGWELGRLWGEGYGVQDPRSGAALWTAPRFDVGASWTFAGTGLRLGLLLTLAVPLARDDFVLGELGTVHRPPAGVGRVALGLDWISRGDGSGSGGH
jgi:hypothetical protein